jgi:hypothetical protein
MRASMNTQIPRPLCPCCTDRINRTRKLGESTPYALGVRVYRSLWILNRLSYIFSDSMNRYGKSEKSIFRHYNLKKTQNVISAEQFKWHCQFWVHESYILRTDISVRIQLSSNAKNLRGKTILELVHENNLTNNSQVSLCTSFSVF